MRFDADATRKFLSQVMLQDTCLEMRIFKAQWGHGNGFIERSQLYSSTFAGWYNRPDTFVADAGRLKDASGYLVPNPVDPAFIASSDNRLRKVARNEATSKENIIALRWLYLDFDPVKPGKEMSALDSELAETAQKRDRIFLEFPELSPHALWGCSGNGSWALIRLPDYPNDDEHKALVARAIKFFAQRFGADIHTKDPGRLMPLVGTLKCKGENKPDRPWRFVTMDSPPLPADVAGFPLSSWVAERLPPEPEPRAKQAKDGSTKGKLTLVVPKDSRLSAYATTALNTECDKVATAPPGTGNDALHTAAYSMGNLIAGGYLDRVIVEQSLTQAATVRGRDLAEIQSTLASGLEYGMGRPRDLVGELSIVPRITVPLLPREEGGASPAVVVETEYPTGREDNPHRLSTLFLNQECNHADGYTLRFWQDQFYQWTNGHYKPQARAEIKARIAQSINKEFNIIYAQALMNFEARPQDSKPPRLFGVTTNLVGHVMQAVAGMVMVESAAHSSLPCWVGPKAAPFNAEEAVPLLNGILHLPGYIADKLDFVPPTPLYFATHLLNYAFNHKAANPERWIKFLSELWPNNCGEIETLQEWFGLQLLPDTSYQKILAMIGPPGSGKGTIARVMQTMVGASNCQSTRLSMFGEKFSLESLIGKLCLIIPDGRLSPLSDQVAILETLVNVSGQDPLTIPRKYREDWHGSLKSRITFISNDIPQFTDPSDALARRWLFLRFTETFNECADKDLEGKLMAEMPGIFAWAVQGWKRLKERGRFVQPETGNESLAVLHELANPLFAFADECCVMDESDSVECNILFRAYREWCDRNNRRSKNSAIFARDLHSAFPSVKTIQRRVGNGARDRFYRGIGLIPPSDFGTAPTPALPLGEQFDFGPAPF